MLVRVVTMLVVLGTAVVAFAAVGLATPTPTAGTATPGTPTGSPEASPSASPIGSPGASPVAVVGDVARGKSLTVQCLACHTTDGTVKVGPSWKGLYGSEVELDNGQTVIADAAYLHQSIVDPMSQIVKGFPPAMPPYNYLSEKDIQDIIAYIESLK
jgi:cytochrome c oxidase subunit 2